MRPIHFIVPGPLDQLTGGYLFDRHLIAGLRAEGRAVMVHELPGQFPVPDIVAEDAAAALLARLSPEAAIVVDGLALLAFAEHMTPAMAAERRLIAFVHHPLALETGLASGLRERIAMAEARMMSRSRGVLCPSGDTAWAVAEYGVPNERIAVTPPGTFKPATPAPRRGGTPDRPLQLLSVGAVTPRKGHLLLIEALAELADRPWRLLCVGSLTRDPDCALALDAAIERHRLRERVLLAGEWPPERLGVAYADADVFVLASYHEGYGMAFAEALAHGLPVVGTTGGAIPETVPAEASLLVPPGDRAALTSALRMLLDGSALRQRLAEGAAAAGKALPDWTAAVRQWAAALDRLAA